MEKKQKKGKIVAGVAIEFKSNFQESLILLADIHEHVMLHIGNQL